MKTTSAKKLLFFLTLLPLSSAYAEEMTGRQIIEKQKELHKAKTEIITQKMILVDKSGKKEERLVKTSTKETSEKDVFKTLVVFLEPADVKGTALLSWQHKDQDDDQWLFLPAQKKMQRIAKGSKKNYFMGTDFTYEDMSREDPDTYNYKVLRAEKLGEQDCYVVEATPASPDKLRESSYSKRLLWITKDHFVTLKTEFYDKRDKLAKTQENREWEPASGTAWRAKKGLMDNQSAKHKTLVGLVEKTLNQPIEDKVFTERYVLSGAHTQ